MTIVGVASSGMASADRHGASRIFPVKLPTDLGVCPRAYWTHRRLGFSAARGKRVIALTAALYADGELKGRKP
jgi:hypothetical protein